ncbi:uncharacterized protein B0H64DRAFT_392737 [Chaetomium fimeti]|uniref:Uncharacterized protein n=1 Tax=Chaetomium fimeti TaxID=1854472 RepID=A0AAE0LU65_9PEZI|nr:hypothetical protein B0H64DRAFT_392737 [Chaetomium fimeti]
MDGWKGWGGGKLLACLFTCSLCWYRRGGYGSKLADYYLAWRGFGAKRAVFENLFRIIGVDCIMLFFFFSDYFFCFVWRALLFSV